MMRAKILTIGLMCGVALIGLWGCENTQETVHVMRMGQGEPLLILSTVEAEGVPLALADKGGGPVVREQLQNYAALPMRDWRVAAAHMRACLATEGCPARALGFLWEHPEKR